MNLKGLEQERGAYAYSRVKEIATKEWADDYKSYVKSAPTLILTNGLAQTLAFYKSKKKEACDRLFDDIDLWMRGRYYTPGQNCGGKKVENALEWLINCASSIEVLEATQDVLSLLNWFKRFVDAMIEKDNKKAVVSNER